MFQRCPAHGSTQLSSAPTDLSVKLLEERSKSWFSPPLLSIYHLSLLVYRQTILTIKLSIPIKTVIKLTLAAWSMMYSVNSPDNLVNTDC